MVTLGLDTFDLPFQLSMRPTSLTAELFPYQGAVCLRSLHALPAVEPGLCCPLTLPIRLNGFGKYERTVWTLWVD